MRLHHPAIILGSCLLLAACGSDKTAATQPSTGDESLPKPDAAAGSVTGMPNPGTPATLPPPADNLATDDEDPDIATEGAAPVDPNLPLPPPVTLEGHFGKPPPDAMPVMPAHPPAHPDQSQIQAVPPPPPPPPPPES